MASPGLTINRQTVASYAPIPINVITDQGGWSLMLDGHSRNYRVPGNILESIDMPPQFLSMFLITIVTPDDEFSIFDWDGHPTYVNAITITDGFRWQPGWLQPPQCTYRPTYIGNNGFIFESGMSILGTCPPGLPVGPDGVPFGAVGLPPVVPHPPMVGKKK